MPKIPKKRLDSMHRGSFSRQFITDADAAEPWAPNAAALA